MLNWWSKTFIIAMMPNKTVQATPMNVAVIRCAVTPAACAALVPAPLGHPFWYGVPDLIR